MADLDDAALVRRAAERFGFGCVPGELDRLQRAGWASWLDTRLRGPITADPGAAATPVPALPPLLAGRPTRRPGGTQAAQRRTP